MAEINVNASGFFSPLMMQLLKTEAVLFSYAKTTLSQEKFKVFTEEIGRQFKMSIKDCSEDFPEIFKGSEEIVKQIVSELEKPQ